MDSNVFSLIEIEGEDDSLIKQAHAEDIDSFACSPLTAHGSHIASGSHQTTMTTENITRMRPARPSPQGEKENISSSNSNLESNTLSLEPQKMKRSRKNGAINLRKSLAWDKAFFTEEGVLSASELSLICGTKVDGEGLTAICEEPSEPCQSVSSGLLSDLQTQEVKSSTNSTCLRKDISGHSPLKLGSKSQAHPAPPSVEPKKKLLPVVKQNVLSDGGCAKSSSSVSQKRPLIASPAKPAKRNAKVISAPVSKPDTKLRQPTTRIPRIGSVCSTTRNAQPATSIPQPATPTVYHTSTSVQKHVNSKGSSTKKSPSAAKMGSRCVARPTKTDQNSTRKLANSTVKEHPSTNRKVPLGNQPSSSGVMLDKNLPRSKGEQKNTSNISSEVIVSSHTNSGDARPSSTAMQVQKVKPSGLRMPTPSQRFFSETKNSIYSGVGQTNIRPSKLPRLGIPPIKNQGAKGQINKLKPPNTTGREDEVTNDVLSWDGQPSAKELSISSTIGIKPPHAAIQRDEGELLLGLKFPSDEKTVTTQSNGQQLHNSYIVKESELKHVVTQETDGFKPHHLTTQQEGRELMSELQASSDENTVRTENSKQQLNHSVDDVKTSDMQHEQTSQTNERMDGKHSDSLSFVVAKEDYNEIPYAVDGKVSQGENKICDADFVQCESSSANKDDLKLGIEAVSEEKNVGATNSGLQLYDIGDDQNSDMEWEETSLRIEEKETEDGSFFPVVSKEADMNMIQSSDKKSEPQIAVAGKASPGENESTDYDAGILQCDFSATIRCETLVEVQSPSEEKAVGIINTESQLNEVNRNYVEHAESSLIVGKMDKKDSDSLSLVVNMEDAFSHTFEDGTHAVKNEPHSSDRNSDLCIAVTGKASSPENKISDNYAIHAQCDLLATDKGYQLVTQTEDALYSCIETSYDKSLKVPIGEIEQCELEELQSLVPAVENIGSAKERLDEGSFQDSFLETTLAQCALDEVKEAPFETTLARCAPGEVNEAPFETTLSHIVDDVKTSDMEHERTSLRFERVNGKHSNSLSSIVSKEEDHETPYSLQEGGYAAKNMLRGSRLFVSVAGEVSQIENEICDKNADIVQYELSATNKDDLNLGIQVASDEMIVGTTNIGPLLNDIDDVQNSDMEFEQIFLRTEGQDTEDGSSFSPVGFKEANNEIIYLVQEGRNTDKNMTQSSDMKSEPRIAVAKKASSGENESSDCHNGILQRDFSALNRGEILLEVKAPSEEKDVGIINTESQQNDSIYEVERMIGKDSDSPSVVVNMEECTAPTPMLQKGTHVLKNEPQSSATKSCIAMTEKASSVENKISDIYAVDAQCDLLVIDEGDQLENQIGDALYSCTETCYKSLKFAAGVKEQLASVELYSLIPAEENIGSAKERLHRGSSLESTFETNSLRGIGEVGEVPLETTLNHSVDDVKTSDMEYEQTSLGNERVDGKHSSSLVSVVAKEEDNEISYSLQEGRYALKNMLQGSKPCITVAEKVSQCENEICDSYADIVQYKVSATNPDDLKLGLQVASEEIFVGDANNGLQLSDAQNSDMECEKSSLRNEGYKTEDGGSFSPVVSTEADNTMTYLAEEGRHTNKNMIQSSDMTSEPRIAAAGKVSPGESESPDCYAGIMQCDFSATNRGEMLLEVQIPANENPVGTINTVEVKRKDMEHERFLIIERVYGKDSDSLSLVVNMEECNAFPPTLQKGTHVLKTEPQSSVTKSDPFIAVTGKASSSKNKISDIYAVVAQCDSLVTDKDDQLDTRIEDALYSCIETCYDKSLKVATGVQAPSEDKPVGTINTEPRLNDSVDGVESNDMEHEESCLIIERMYEKDSDSPSLVVNMEECTALTPMFQKGTHVLKNVPQSSAMKSNPCIAMTEKASYVENKISDIYSVDAQCDLLATDKDDQLESQIEDALYSCTETCYNKSLKVATGVIEQWAPEELHSPIPAEENIGSAKERLKKGSLLEATLETSARCALREVKETSFESSQVLSLSDPIAPGEQSATTTREKEITGTSSCSGHRRVCMNLTKGEIISCNTKLLPSPDVGNDFLIRRLSGFESSESHLLSNEAEIDIEPLHQNQAQTVCSDDKSESLCYAKLDDSGCRESCSPKKNIGEQVQSETFQDPLQTLAMCKTGVSLNGKIIPEDEEALNQNQSVIRDNSLGEIAHLDPTRPSRAYEVLATTPVADDDKMFSMDVSECKTQQETLPFMDANDETITKDMLDDKMQTDLVIKTPVNAAPFSEEWLSAIEAAGEEILTQKSGRVQNSPPSASSPEPGPWSPVKRKNSQSIGPFDCTKFTKPEE